MTSLTRVAVTARKIIRYAVFFIIFLIIGRILFNVGRAVYLRIFPPPPPPPTVTFGKLPKLPFPDNPRPKLTYVLETPEGGLPKLTTQAKVYFMPKLSANLLSLDVTKEKADALGFSSDEQKVSDTVYRFKRKDSPSTLEINIVTGVFSISYDLKADPSPIGKRPPAPEIAASELRSYLSAADLLPQDLTGTAAHEFLKLDKDKLVSALALSEADLIKINLFRKSFDKLPSMTIDPAKANVWFLVSGNQGKEKQVVAGEFHYFPVDESKFSTYPIKTPQKAWDELSQGQGFIASVGANKDGDTVKIRRVYLGYLDAGMPMNFFQPIYVFEGDNGLIAYDPAVTGDYYGE